MAADLFEDCFAAGATRAFMAQRFAKMGATLEQSSALLRTYMLGLKKVIPRSRSKRTLLALVALSFNSFPFSRTTSLVASMPSTIEKHFAGSSTLRRFLFPLMTDCLGRRSATSALDLDNLHARRAASGMAKLFIGVSARERLSTSLLAVRNGIRTCSSNFGRKLDERRLPARTMVDDIRRSRAVLGCCGLDMTILFARMLTAIKQSSTGIPTVK